MNVSSPGVLAAKAARSLGGGSIAGIVIAVLIIVIILVVAAIFIKKRYFSNTNKPYEEVNMDEYF